MVNILLASWFDKGKSRMTDVVHRYKNIAKCLETASYRYTCRL